MVTAQQAELHRRLRADGATTREAVEVLLAAQEVSTIELALGAAAAWKHEQRGPGGRWISSGEDLRREAEHEANIRQIAHETALKTAVAQDVAFDERLRREQAQRDAAQSAQIRALQRQVRRANQRISEIGEQTEKKKARTKSLAVISSLVGGAVLGAVEARLGTPDLAAIASSVAPGVIESLFEWKKKL